jgi:hypothetical protein
MGSFSSKDALESEKETPNGGWQAIHDSHGSA